MSANLLAAQTTNKKRTRRSRRTASQQLGVVELFAGAGGLAQGFSQSGHFDLIALSDIDAIAKLTFEANYSSLNTEYICEDVRDLKIRRLIRNANGRRVSGVLGGPPCQGFSLAGLKKSDDERNRLIGDYVRFVKALKPDFLLMENVPQVIFHHQFKLLLKELETEYNVQYAVLNAAQYGVAQTRHRTFVLAFHRRLGIEPSFPKPTNGFTRQFVYNYRLRRMENSRCKSADKEGILGADPIIVRAIEESSITFSGEESVAPLITIEKAIGDLSRGKGINIPNHVARSHQGRLLELINQIPEGGNLKDVDEKLHPKSHYSQAYGRLHRKGLARTITTWFQNAGSGRFIHPTEPRTLTIREAARLQGFSDEFEFHGTLEDQMRLIGNAVPPKLAQAIAERIWRDLAEIL